MIYRERLDEIQTPLEKKLVQIALSSFNFFSGEELTEQTLSIMVSNTMHVLERHKNEDGSDDPIRAYQVSGRLIFDNNRDDESESPDGTPGIQLRLNVVHGLLKTAHVSVILNSLGPQVLIERTKL